MIPRLRQLITQLLGRKFVQDTLVLQVGKLGMLLLSLLSTVLIGRLVGPKGYGDFGLAQSFLVILQTLDLTGIGQSTSTRLAMAIGARDEGAILDLLGNYVKVSVAINAAIAVLIGVVGGALAARLYDGNSQIGLLALGLAVATVGDALYNMVLIALQSRRSMRTLALLQNANQLTLTTCLIIAVLVAPTAASMVVARLVYSFGTMLLAFAVYRRQRTQGQVSYPPLLAVFRRAVTVSPRPYWRFGVANAIDKNLSQLFTQVPIQLVGIYAGTQAVGYLNLAINGIAQAGIFTSAIFENMQAVVPQAVGRKDYAGLRRNFIRVLLVLGTGGAFFYTFVALAAPLLIPPILGERWLPAVAPLGVLAIYGAINTVGGIFGPLYRAFNMMRQAILIKLIGIAILIPTGILLLHALSAKYTVMATFWGTGLLEQGNFAAKTGAVGGAMLIVLVFFVTVALTAWVTLPELRRRAASGNN